MSTQNNHDTVVPNSELPVIGSTGKLEPRTELFKRLLDLLKIRVNLLILVLVILLAVLGFAMFRFGPLSHEKIVQDIKKPQTPVQMLLLGKSSDAQKALDGQIASTSSTKEKAGLYIQKSGVAYGDKNYKDSLSFAQQAEKLQPSAESANMIAKSAEGLGNKPLAVKYYQLQLKRMAPVRNMDTYDNLTAKIKELEN